jgi:hypothetical protein
LARDNQRAGDSKYADIGAPVGVKNSAFPAAVAGDPDRAGFSSRNGWVENAMFLRDDKVHLISRKKNNLNERFPELREIGKAIRANAALIDGEIFALDFRPLTGKHHRLVH